MLLQSGDENLGIKLEYFLNKAILGTIYFENFNSFIQDEVQPYTSFSDLSYFNNLSKTNNGIFKGKFNLEHIRQVGYLDF